MRDLPLTVPPSIDALSKVAANMLVSKYAVEAKVEGNGIIFLALSPGFVYTQHDGPLEEGEIDHID